ncbi:MAG: hypothetical protein R3B47_04370 [Bacteroidia bacterium]
MRRENLGQRLIGIFLVAFVLLNFPMIAIWGKESHAFGFPMLFVGIFGVWTALIVLLVWMMRRSSP